jgi:F-type H+-transporting ATPase subunit delta
MKESRIAIRYAKALFDLSIEKDSIERVNEDMKLVHEVCKANKDFSLLLANPVVRKDKKDAIIHEIFEKHLQKMSLLFLDIITKSGREDFIELIAEEFTKLYKKYKGIITTTLQTVVEIDDEIRKSLIDLLEKQSDANIELVEKLDKTLIGGFVFKYDNLEYDASIRTRIQKLRRDFENNLYVKGF